MDLKWTLLVPKWSQNGLFQSKMDSSGPKMDSSISKMDSSSPKMDSSGPKIVPLPFLSSLKVVFQMCLEYMFLASGMKLLWGGKTRGRSFISESKIFISEIKWSFFEIGQLPKSSEARFWQSRSRKRTIWSRKWKSCSKKGKSPRVLLPKKQVNSRG